MPPLRCAPLVDTLRHCCLLAGACGISRVADITGLDDLGIPVVSVIRPASRSLSVASGKGLTLQQACVSGLMEALELFHAEQFGDWIALGGLPPEIRTVDLSSLPSRAGARTAAHLPPASLRMANGTDLATCEAVAVPFDLVHADFRLQAKEASGFITSSNGLGGGNSCEEAVLQGLLEVIEGDAVALLRARRHVETHLPTRWSVADAETMVLVERCRLHGIEVAAWDIATDIGVPTFYCRLLDNGGRQGIAIATDGAGCHVRPAVALKRALLEAVQTRLLLISGARDDIRPRYYERSVRAAPVAGPTAALDTTEGYDGASVADAIEWVIARLAAAGFRQAIAVDLQSRSDALHFARVIVPGLEAFPHSRGYRPGVRAQMAAARR